MITNKSLVTPGQSGNPVNFHTYDNLKSHCKKNKPLASIRVSGTNPWLAFLLTAYGQLVSAEKHSFRSRWRTDLLGMSLELVGVVSLRRRKCHVPWNQ